MESGDITEIAGKLVEIIAGAGNFAVGTLFGSILASVIYWLASKQNTERAKFELDQQKQLLAQNTIKDKRIDKLHSDIDKLIKKKK